ncbi:uncharacterized protein MYCFIDRAFT_170844 [Pseudocercospora fijiensis CIRAD86]|uniref:Uncharacterized protein n=1 Tax=Pseudocercospora fijiensis (strain CIRAD86) TaxID=383855 RepID=N1QCV9_PSEFD|nr:uncharacterized protein MYCFIDRAFT_170844 [Pseudocercospora fijiensis CIRAD86]EME89388.1 hypothetical protein MYCFIDRAFT_170844 [Pseudocercospora fijiensis CIRAD86]
MQPKKEAGRRRQGSTSRRNYSSSNVSWLNKRNYGEQDRGVGRRPSIWASLMDIF